MPSLFWKKVGAAAKPVAMTLLGALITMCVTWANDHFSDSRRRARVMSILADEVEANQTAIANRSVFDTIRNPVAGEALRVSRRQTTDPVLVQRVFSTSARDKVETDIDALAPRTRKLLRRYYDMISSLRRDNVRYVPTFAEHLQKTSFDSCSRLYLKTATDTNVFTFKLGDSLLRALGVASPDTLRL
jgi:hypothetical protein